MAMANDPTKCPTCGGEVKTLTLDRSRPFGYFIESGGMSLNDRLDMLNQFVAALTLRVEALEEREVEGMPAYLEESHGIYGGLLTEDELDALRKRANSDGHPSKNDTEV